MEHQETKVCSLCHRELPVSEFYGSAREKDGRQSRCKECQKEYARRRNKSKVVKQVLDPDVYFDERFKGITPRELIDELRKRGYTGRLEYKEVRIHEINL